MFWLKMELRNAPQLFPKFARGQKVRNLVWIFDALKRRDIFPFHSPGGVTYHTAHTAKPLLSTQTGCTSRSAIAEFLFQSVFCDHNRPTLLMCMSRYSISCNVKHTSLHNLKHPTSTASRYVTTITIITTVITRSQACYENHILS